MDVQRTKRNLSAFCECIYKPTDVVEVRNLPNGASDWLKAGEIADYADRLLQKNFNKANIYFGGNPRKDIGGTKAEDVALARCLFADFDHGATDETIKAKLKEQGFLEPTVMLNSGHGIHCWWRLDEPINDLKKWTQLQKRLIATLGSDAAIHDPPRIMRAPGFTNHKPPVAEAKVIYADKSRRYDLWDVEEHLDSLPVLEQAPEAIQIPAPTSEEDKLRRAIAYIDKVDNCAEGEGRNNIAQRIGRVLLNDFGLDFETAWPFAVSWNQGNQPPLPEKELQSAFVNGKRYARRPEGNKLIDRRTVSGNGETTATITVSDEPGSMNLPVDNPYGLNNTDAGNARKLAELYGGRLRYCWDTNCWLYFDGKRWNLRIGDEYAHKCAKKTSKTIYKTAIKIVDSTQRKQAVSWAIRTDQEQRQNAMISSARSEDVIGVYQDEYDTDDFLLNCKNAVIDLRTMEVKNHSPEFKITKMTDVEYLPGATCHHWERCVSEWMDGNEDKIDYLQRTLGMCLTGDISARAFPIWHGQGRNGKSACLDTVKAILGDYARVGSEDLLAEKKMAQHPCDIADLNGCRLVIVDETKKNMKLRASLVKRMTGDRVLKGRLMRQNFTEFKTTHKTILMTQNLPVITETADAIWDRVHLLKWNHRFEPGNPKLLEELRPEYPGILNWLLEGCRKWIEDGYLLNKPNDVEAATTQYREDSDPLGDFIEEKCVLGPLLLATVEQMWTTYQNWDGIDEKYKPGRRNFNNYLEERGATRGQRRIDDKNTKCWIGIDLQ